MGRSVISVGTMHYRELNERIRESIAQGSEEIVLEDVIGQRYIGAGLEKGVHIEIHGVPGQDLGVFMGGAELTVHGNAQDGVGNTMNDGSLVVHGSVGDIPGHMARSGRIYIRGKAGFRAGIMMKEYRESHPVMIIGESAGDYLGEYMAGGTIVVLGYGCGAGQSAVDRHVASGIFGGTLFVRGLVEPWQLGKGAVMEPAAAADMDGILPRLREFAVLFGLEMDRILSVPFTVIRRAGQRPYGGLYVNGNKVGRSVRPQHRNLTPPCAAACPIGIPNPVIIRHLKEGRLREAFSLIDEYTPFRHSCCGMVCPGLCRASCSRNRLGQAVRIDEISRDYHPSAEAEAPAERQPEKAAVIGSGPAGLSAAWQLARRGYAVDVYERDADIGGKLTHNIPEDRLPREGVERDLARIRSLGVRFHTGKGVDAASFKKIRSGHDAVVVAIGAQKPRRLGFPGEDEAVTSYAFLRAVREGSWQRNLQGVDACIVGAGNVAMDAAAECFRLGASSVTAVDVRKPLAFGKEMERARALGTRILFPRVIAGYRDGVVSFKEGEALRAGFLIVSVGEVPELDFAGESLVLTKGSFTTNLPMVYACGDAVAPGLVTHSVGMGRKVALQIHATLRGLAAEEAGTEPFRRENVKLVYFQAAAADSLEECFSCGTCVQCDICVNACPRAAIARQGESFTVKADLCTGCGVCAEVCPRGAITMAEK